MKQQSIFLLTLRRLRAPLLLMIGVYAVGIVGLVLIPGVDADGRPIHMGFFHAFYFMTYTASTIGFGEIPYAFTDTQRLWVTFVIILSVVGWAYTLTSFLALGRDRGFRLAVTMTLFRRQVRGLREPFYVVCGFGETGSLVCRGLEQIGVRFVVLDVDPHRIDELELQAFHGDVPALVCDARLPEHLLLAGVAKPNCLGTLALTNDDACNLAVAITMKLISPKVPVLCRATRGSTVANMESFDTDHVINPFRAFGAHLWDALHAPCMHRLMLQLTGLPGTWVVDRREPPRGHWIVCGYGRFGREVVGSFLREGLSVTIIDPESLADEGKRVVRGLGTEAATLREAGLHAAVGIVAGTDDDINNLSIVMTARAERPQLFTVVRQNLQANRVLFRRFGADMTMVSAEIIANEALARIGAPLLTRFLRYARTQTEAWADVVDKTLESNIGNEVPLLWEVRIDASDAPAWSATLGEARGGALQLLGADPSDRDRRLACVPLLVVRGREEYPMPPEAFDLLPGDTVLFAGTATARSRQSLIVCNANVLHYVESGIEAPGGFVWQWLNRRRIQAKLAAAPRD
jgi:Trk K+ transport system NAD-binding subunit